MTKRNLGILLLTGLLFSPAALPQGASSRYLADSAAGVEALQTWYSQDTGLWKTTGWWNSANGLTVLVNYSKLTGKPDLLPVIANTFDRNSGKNFLNKFYDDEGWWALGWAGAYELTHQQRYLDMSATIFADMADSWSDTCGGGIWWSKDKKYKNAIANELFLAVAGKLASLTEDSAKRAQYLDWAQREWKWFQSSGMINAEHLVNDGLDSACHNNHGRVWTYNQGVILGGLTYLAKVSGDNAPLEPAQAIATAAIARLSDSAGILHDGCEPDHCGNDGVQFKGIFSRNLAILNASKYQTFLETNADAIWKNRSPENKFGVVWSAPGGVTTAATQISALDDLVAAAQSEAPSAKP